MGRAPCCDKANVKKGPWSPEEDAKLKEFIDKFGTGGNWIALPQKVGLKRCGKSCRLRWLNYLRPNIKHGEFSDEEDRIICTLYATIGSRWSIIAAQLPGRTDNDIKNYWNTKLKKKLMGTNIPYSNHLAKLVSSHPFPGNNINLQTQSHHQHLHTPDHYNSFYFQAALESISPPQENYHPYSNFSLSTTQYSYNYLQNQDGNLVDNNNNNNNNNNNMLVFGGMNEAASCSSSDGSCSQISYGGGGGKGRVKQEEMGFVSNGSVESGKQRFMLHDHYGRVRGDSMVFGDQKEIGFNNVENSELLLQCDDLEQVKQLISNNNDENKTLDDQRLMYYYQYC